MTRIALLQGVDRTVPSSISTENAQEHTAGAKREVITVHKARPIESNVTNVQRFA
jgi:hypothetical protein